jgi:hypothetical protein
VDGKPTHIIPFIVGPKGRRNEHIGLLAAISRVLRREAVAEELLAARTPTSLRESFLRHLGDPLSADATSRRNLITVHIQDEGLFAEMLQLLSEAEDCSISVFDAHSCSEYLHRLPLFAAFWSESRKGFHRVITATIRHSMANEMLRRIDALVGGMRGRQGMQVLMQDIGYCEGTLDI